MSRAGDSQRRWPRRLAALFVAFVALSILQTWRGETGLTSLIRFGDRFETQSKPELLAVPHLVLEDSFGYDGQFYAQMALDPALLEADTAAAMDDAPYRFRRILQSWLAALSGLGHPWWVLQCYVLWTLVAWLGLAGVLWRILRPADLAGLLRWSGCLAAAGTVASLTHALPDLLAVLGIFAAVRLQHQGRSLGAGLALALAILAKETSLCALPLLWCMPGSRRALRALTHSGLALLPFAVWMSYLALGGHSWSEGQRNFDWPLVATLLELSEATRFASEGHFANLVCLAALLVCATACAAWLFVRRPPDVALRAASGYLLLGVALGPAVWEGNPGAAYRVLLPVTIAFNLLLPRRSRLFWPLLLTGNLSALVGLRHLLDLWR